MSAEIIRLSASETHETPCSYVHTRRPSLPSSLRGAARRSWCRIRLTVEAWGWINVAVLIVALIFATAT